MRAVPGMIFPSSSGCLSRGARFGSIWQARLARGFGFYLSALACQPDGVVAIPFPHHGTAGVGDVVVAFTPEPRAAGGMALFCWDVVSSTGLFQCLSLLLFVRS